MNRRRLIPIAIGVVLLAALAWAVTAALERLTRPEPPVDGTIAAPRGVETPHIAATLFYASPQGDSLVAVRREVPLAEGVEAQARQILVSQLDAPPAPYVSAIPKGTTLRSFFVTTRGDAFVDLSQHVTTAHPGGSMTELLTVHAIVNAVTANLPAIQRVQIMVDGKEVDTLAGHVDVRRPLIRDTSLVTEPASP